jgi:hypothetical protein
VRRFEVRPAGQLAQRDAAGRPRSLERTHVAVKERVDKVAARGERGVEGVPGGKRIQMCDGGIQVDRGAGCTGRA